MNLSVNRAILSVIVLVFAGNIVLADPPQTIYYQGVLTDALGNPITGDTSLSFYIYSEATGGVAIWGETQSVTLDSDGLFSVALGSVLPLHPLLFDGVNRWLSVRIAGEEILPRTKFMSVPYAFNGGGWIDAEDYIKMDDFSNNVGLNTSFPKAKLHVVDSDTLAGYFTGTNDNPYGTVLKVEYTGPNSSDYDATAVRGIANQNIYSEYGIGGHFEGGYYGVRGQGYSAGVSGTGQDDNGTTIGVRGTTNTTNIGNAYGMYAYGYGTEDANIYGLYAGASGTTTGSKYAGYFSGNVNVTGTLSKGGGSFKIDHPLDPENKYLYHSFVESPDMMNVYNGNIVTDQNGEAMVELPEYFSALNEDFRYQLTVIGSFSQAIIAEEIMDNRFKIMTDKPNVKVSWQVTGIRKDAWAEKNRIEVEVEKRVGEKGYYLYPEVYGLEYDKSIDYQNNKEAIEGAESSR
jgi:hypothetical protein